MNLGPFMGRDVGPRISSYRRGRVHGFETLRSNKESISFLKCREYLACANRVIISVIHIHEIL